MFLTTLYKVLKPATVPMDPMTHRRIKLIEHSRMMDIYKAKRKAK